MVMRWLMAIALSGCLVACLRAEEPSAEETAVRAAVVQILTQVQDSRFAEAWDSMHPAYQAVIPREQLVDCGERYPPVFVSFDILEVENEDYLADEIGMVDAWVAAVRFEANDAFKIDSGTSGMIDRSFNYVETDDGWRWFPGTGELRTFREGGCGLPWPGHSVFGT